MNRSMFDNGVKSKQPRTIRNRINSTAAICLMIVLACGWPAAAGAETPTQGKIKPTTDPDRLILVLKTRRQLPDSEFLTSLLDHPDPRSRWLAVHDLGETDNTKFIQLLVPLLDDPNPEVRRQTRQALLTLCQNQNGVYAMYKKAMAALSPPGRLMAQAVWNDSKGRERSSQYYQKAFNLAPQRYWAAFHAMPPGQIINRIRDTLDKDLSRIESQIGRYMADPHTMVPLDELRYAFALTVFAEILERDIARSTMNSNDLKSTAEVRQQAADVLSGVRKTAEKAKAIEIKLSQQEQRFMASDFDPGLAESASLAQARALAAHELGSINTPEAAAALKEALATDPNPLVRVRAADSLEKLCPPDIHQALIRSVQDDPSPDVKRAALIALGCRDSDDSRRIIRKYAEDSEYLEAAILATANLGTADDLAYLFELADQILVATSKDEIPSLSEPDFGPTAGVLVQALKIIAPKHPNNQPAIDSYIQSLTRR
jgi:HEAT repeat protein